MPTVLIVDDTAVDRRLAGGLLESAPNVDVCYAQNGSEALLQISTSLPDLVVTDLQMPDVDGLELVNTIGEKYPDLPVVLMTAHGSENVAAQALASGAACYVPKSELAENLVDTVMHILVMAESESRYQKLISCATKTEFEFNLENDLSIIEPLVDMIQQITLSQGLLTHSGQVQMGVALDHALQNAIVRGNLELSRDDTPVLSQSLIQERAEESAYADRRVYFKALITPEIAEFTLRDMGPGFDTANVPKADDPDSFRDGRGRGLVLIQSFMDRVEFGQNGSQLILAKNRAVKS